MQSQKASNEDSMDRNVWGEDAVDPADENIMQILQKFNCELTDKNDQ